MTYLEQRSAERVPCQILARVRCRLGDLEATACDISRVGVRLRLPLAALGTVARDDLGAVADTVERYIGAWFRIELSCRADGALVRKPLRITRLAQWNMDDYTLHLGCEFGSPLSDEQASLLGLEFPRDIGACAPRIAG